MWDYKLTSDNIEKVNTCKSLDELMELMSEDAERFLFDVEVITAEHFREDKLKLLATGN